VTCVSTYSVQVKYNLFLPVTARKDKAFTPFRSSEPGPSTSFQPSASASTSSASATRSLTRTNSRPRFGRHSAPDTRSPLQAPDLNILTAGDSSQFLDLVKTVAERVDENASFRAAKNEDLIGMKRKIRGTSSISAVDVSARVRKSRLAVASTSSTARDETRVNRTTGIHKEDSGTEPEHESNSSDNFIPELPHLSSSSFTSTSSSSLDSINTSMQVDVEVADTSATLSTSTRMDMDASDGSKTSHAHKAPLPQRRTLSRTNSASSGSAADLIPPDSRSTTTVKPTISTPRLHPLLSQQQSQRQHPPPRVLPPQPAQQPPRVYPPPQRIQRPPASQTSAMTRPPALGMRRTHSVITKSQTANVPLPTRQKAFKPPLQSQPHQPQAQLRARQPQTSHSVIGNIEKDRVQPIKTESSTSHWGERNDKKEIPNHRPPNISDKPSSTEANPDSNPDADADSSFGDMSFDIDALEETMRMYD
jgi:hypothetical protein